MSLPLAFPRKILSQRQARKEGLLKPLRSDDVETVRHRPCGPIPFGEHQDVALAEGTPPHRQHANDSDGPPRPKERDLGAS
jgi:hypothetical protein